MYRDKFPINYTILCIINDFLEVIFIFTVVGRNRCTCWFLEVPKKLVIHLLIPMTGLTMPGWVALKDGTCIAIFYGFKYANSQMLNEVFVSCVSFQVLKAIHSPGLRDCANKNEITTRNTGLPTPVQDSVYFP